jgi:PAS domain S-box-containing protein
MRSKKNLQPILDEEDKFLEIKGSKRDSIERKQIEEALAKQHEELQTILDTVPASIFYKDKENRFLRVNKSFTQMMELPKEELEGKSVFDLYPREQAEAFWRDDKEVITTGKPKTYIIERVQTKKGLLWVQTHKIPYRDERGNIIGVLGFAIDITERKQAEEAVKKSELRYRRLFESAKDGILLIDFDTGMIMDANPFLTDLLGYSKDEILKKHLWEIGVLKDIIPSKKNFLELQKKGYIRYEDLPIQTQDGEKINVEFVSNVYDVDSTKTIQCNIRNITERKKAEEQLRETRDYLENLLNYANAPIIVWDKDFKILRFNHAFEHLTGYTSKMMIGKYLDFLFPEDSKKESMQKIQRTLSGEYWESVEIPIKNKDRNIRIVLWNSANIYDNNGKNLIATIAQGTDITERKLAEKAVLQAKVEWERTFDSDPDLIAILDKSHKIVRANKAMAQRLGIPPEQCINLNCYMCVHGNTKPPKFCPHTLTLKDGKEHIAELYEDKLGGYFLVSTTPIFDDNGTLVGAVHVARDITDRKRVEEALKESESRLNRAQELAHLGSWELDLANNHLIWSDEVYRIFGLQGHEFEATYDAFLQLVHPEDRAAVDAAYSESLREGRDTYEIEHRVMRKNGDIRYVHEKCEHIRDKSGKVVRSIGMVQDITERKRMETELQRIEWLLTKRAKSKSQHDEQGNIIRTQPYGDLTLLNQSRLIRDSLGPDLLADIVDDYLDLLETSAAVYEKNGDYAIGIFTSGWCKFMDLASRHRCGTSDNQNALNSGKWLCHESCWTKASKNAIKTGQSTDIECEGGIHIYAVPILAGQEIVGSINFGYGDPPRSMDKLNKLALKYNVNVEELRRHAEAYQTRPLYIIELAKSRLNASARLIGEIVERKQAESELVRLASFPLKNPSPIIEVDLSGTILYLNPVSQQLFPDLEKKEFHHSYLKGIKKLIPEIRKKKTLVQEVQVDDKYFLQTISFIPENRRVRIYGTDITLRKKAEEVLQESEEKYRTIVEHTTNVIMVTQPDGIISYLSPACKDVLGHDPNELVGTNPMIFHPEDATKVQQALSRALEGIKGSNFQYRIITNDGKTKWISHSWTPIVKEGKLQSVVSVIEDVTQRKTAEENIKKLNENLLRHSLELATANKELEAFSYSVSHDLRAPLRSIDGFGQAILEDYADKLDEQGKDYIKRVRTATQRMGQLIDDLLRLSRLSRAELHLEQIDVSSLARTTAEKLQAMDPSRKVKITIQDKISASGDKKLLEILFENLLGNAWKFTGNTKHPAIEFGEATKNDERVYYIQDNGAGFDMAYADKLFIPFQRLHSVDEFPGTGIGLAIVSRVVHRHGGRIWAESEVGKGATFYFTLLEKVEN